MPVSESKDRELRERLKKLGLNKNTVEEKFIRGSGPGGQKINRTANCVYLKHLSTGIEVKVQKSRSRELNRFLAWRLLAEKIEELIFKEKSERRKRIEKIRRQKRRRSRRAKEKMLRDKKVRSEKKSLRGRVVEED